MSQSEGDKILDEDENELLVNNNWEKEGECETDNDGSAEPSPDPRTMYKQCRGLKWKFEEVKARQGSNVLSDRKAWYKGPEGLKANVARSLGDDPFQWFSHVSGCDYEAVAWLARHSNEYFDAYIKPDLGPNNLYHGLKWSPISVQEMYRFLGLLLHMPLNKIDGGGY